MELRASTPKPDNFGNPPWPDGEPPSHHEPVAPAVDLRRVLVGEREEFELRQRISYAARIGERRVTVVVPQADGRFTTDLTSVPRWFTWLVPKSGAHLPAALVHDGLVHDGDGPRTYETDDGDPVDRIDADRVFRDAMRDTHVGVVRRWLVWSAVTLASLWLGPRPAERWPRWWVWYHRAVALLLLGVILYLGAGATAELVDQEVRGLPDLPWMVEGRWWAELATGLSGAVVVPVALSVLWGRYWPAAAIAGVALATLVHATIAVGLVAGGYQLAEAVTDGPRRAPWVVGAGLLAALAVFGWALLQEA